MAILVWKPTRYTRCSNSQASHAMKPPNSSLPTLATALNRDTVAIEPLSKYWNGSRCAGSAPLSSALIVLRRVLAALDRALRQAGHAVDRAPCRRPPRRAGCRARQVGQHLDPAGPVEFDAGLPARSRPSGLADTRPTTPWWRFDAAMCRPSP